jgi:hypothetical protein
MSVLRRIMRGSRGGVRKVGIWVMGKLWIGPLGGLHCVLGAHMEQGEPRVQCKLEGVKETHFEDSGTRTSFGHP